MSLMSGRYCSGMKYAGPSPSIGTASICRSTFAGMHPEATQYGPPMLALLAIAAKSSA